MEGATYHSPSKKCYKFYGDAKTWHDARQQCKDGGGDLAAITDRSTQDFVYGLKGTPYSWIGGYRVDGAWNWSDGSSWNYTNWSRGEPNNYRGRDDYVAMRRHGAWIDTRDDFDFSFLCQYPPVGMKVFEGIPMYLSFTF